VTTEDEVMRLLRHADPDHGRTDAPAVDGIDYLATLRTRSTTVTLIGTEPDPTQLDEGRHRWPMITVAAAALAAIVISSLMLAARDDSEPQVPSATVPPSRDNGFFEGSGPGSPRVTYTVPDGWLNTGFGVVKRNVMIGVYLVNADDGFYTSSCGTTSTRLDQPVGPTVDDLVAAWANQPGVNATAARDVTIDGFDAKQIEFTVPDYKQEDCAGLHYRCSSSSGGGTRPSRCAGNLAPVDPTRNPTSHLYYQAFPNHHQKVWVLDFHGTRLLIVAWSFPNRPQQDRAAIEEIVASIQIG
jgi:hypothetical protein